MLVALIIVITSLIGILLYVAFMEDQLYRSHNIPESELEKSVRQLKLRIADAEWKFKREIGEL